MKICNKILIFPVVVILEVAVAANRLNAAVFSQLLQTAAFSAPWGAETSNNQGRPDAQLRRLQNAFANSSQGLHPNLNLANIFTNQGTVSIKVGNSHKALAAEQFNSALNRFQSTPLTIATSSPSLTLVSSQPTGSLGSSKQVVDEVWQIVERRYIDSTFNGQDWKTVRQQYLNRNYAFKEEAYKAAKEMLEQLGDPLTRFITPEEFKSMQVSSSNPKIASIGLQLTVDKKTKELVVITPLEDTPAFKAGILAKDVLLKIDGQSTQGMNVDQAVTRLRGQVGTRVVLSVKRGQKELEFRITRTPLEFRPVSYRRQKTAKGEIGYIRFTQFGTNAAAEMRQAIKDLEKQQVSGYVLDLRSNLGGLFFSSIEIAQMWLNDGTIVSTIDRQGQKVEQAKNSALTKKPLVVLVNDGSASASEILAAALQENQRATLVGTQTAGYNSIQSVRSLQDGSGLAVTVAKWLTPKGRDISNSGLQPDVAISLTTAQQERLIGKRSVGTPADPQYAKALTILSQLLANR